jgi:tetratricopeptide (TPR) repeat protein
MRHHLQRAALRAALFCALTAPAAAAQTPACTTASALNDAAAALQACTALLATDLAIADRVQALKIRARVARTLHRRDMAVSDIETALKLAPADAELHVLRGWHYFEQFQEDAALAQARRALELDPDEGDAYDLIGRVMYRTGDYARAGSNYDRALQLRPKGLFLRVHRYDLYTAMGRPRDAVAELDAILAFPDAVIAHGAVFEFRDRNVTFRTGARLYRALTLIALDRRNEATAIFDQLVAEDPNTVTFTARAEHHRHYESRPEADIKADLDKAIALDPSYWAPRNSLALLHFYAKRYAAAADDFGRAIELAPARGELRWWRSMALRKLDRIEEATTDALSALDVDPRYIVSRKLEMLRTRGYFQTPKRGADVSAALRDAVQACMLDERCW